MGFFNDKGNIEQFQVTKLGKMIKDSCINKQIVEVNLIMQRKFVDTAIYQARNMERDGNIDFGYWHDKSNEEKLKAALQMISVAFKEPDFLHKKVDRTIFSARKQNV